MIEDWLLKEEKIEINIKNKDNFVDKVIRAIRNMLLRLKLNNNKGILNNINSFIKFNFTFIFIIIASLTRDAYFLISIFGLIIFYLSITKNRKRIIITSMIFPIITLIILLPSMISGNKINSIFIISKVSINIILVNIFSYSTKWQEIAKILKILFIPDIFIWIFEITLKYIVLLGEYLLNVMYSLKTRLIGNNKSNFKTSSIILGNTFLKSIKMSEEMVEAMECRGFNGEYNKKIDFKLKKIDYVYTFISFIPIIFLVYRSFI